MPTQCIPYTLTQVAHSRATVESVGYSCVRSRRRNLSSCLSGTQYGLSQSVLAYTHRYDISESTPVGVGLYEPP